MKFSLLCIYLSFIVPFTVMAQKKQVFTSPSTATRKIVLPDKSEVWMNVKSTLRLPADFNIRSRTVFLSGDAFFKITPGKKPFIIKTAQLHLLSYGASIRVDAYPSPGEEADVLSGQVVAKKSYHSTLDSSEYTLKTGEMVMINRGIDLIEKEKFDTTELRSWLKRFK